ncbi:UDP-diphospho-muramoylpentapeptide beta-N-acetylglucosaminyltransferase [Treponema sp. OMZ 838]|uniref:undecaprenyldiphospho-muramoylpentapeptide beta-N-acetylglucosaminyltransferase n=1 Tax=Treponema sp. OMZ 838 TaxID=1539298 RepID=UPI0005300DE9|nr:undecaprenyldiphospho-muramoylpentapeptide beta-N-acetylglucosaminyltransferase [Treponema sp. OMZ 838]AIW90401.1 UDP-diphospho-muramoylpentapeptide beta-N-acetylglucosaminyltransferase [Treponema sp. OMZ 838]
MSCVIFTGGGTGGHIFPGIAVAEVFKKETGIPIIWIGSNNGTDRSYVCSADIPFYGIPAGKFRRYFSLENLIDVFKIIGGFFASLIILLRLKPRFVFSKGGFVSVPPCAAARCLKIPVITHECDFSPGLATKINTRFAAQIFVSYTKTASFFPNAVQRKITVTGNPVRMRFYEANADAGKAFIQYTGNKPILFIQGGSLGALQINVLVEQTILFLAESFFVVHQTGAQHRAQGERIKKRLKEERPDLSGRYKPFPFIVEQMPDILAASDLVMSRAGANTIWEAAAAGKPMLLLPLEKGSSRGDQIENADFFTEQGAAITLSGKDTTPDVLCSVLTRLLENPHELKAMAQASAALADEKPAVKIAHLLQQWITEE